MPRGSKPGERRGGRQKGQPNKKNQETIERAAATGLLPHEFLLAVSQGQVIDGYQPNFEDRMKAALGAAPYYAPKLASVEQKHSGEMTVNSGVDRPPRETRDEWIARRQREAANVGTATGSAS